LWIDKYDATGSDIYNSAIVSGSTAVNVMGAVGLMNTIGVVWVWIKFLNDFSDSDFWITWFSVLVVNGALWIPITVSWPIAPTAGITFV
jgi:hypothetical protein